MYDIEALEKEWKLYNRKRNKSKYLIAASVLAFAALFIPAYQYLENSKARETKLAAAYDVSKNIITDKPLIAIATKAQNDIATKEVKPKTVSVEDAGPMSYVTKVDDSIDNKKIKNPLIANEKEENVPRKRVYMEITETSSSNAYADVEKRFDSLGSISDSLFLARNYYNRKNYDKAVHWAIESNKINDKLEESWLIFAKSKYKLGAKNEAKSALSVFIKRTNSKKAKSLLDKIKQDRL